MFFGTLNLLFGQQPFFPPFVQFKYNTVGIPFDHYLKFPVKYSRSDAFLFKTLDVEIFHCIFSIHDFSVCLWFDAFQKEREFERQMERERERERESIYATRFARMLNCMTLSQMIIQCICQVFTRESTGG